MVASTGWSGLFDNVHGDGFTTIVDRSHLLRPIAQLFNANQLRGFRELAETATGATAGSAADSSYSRVAHSSDPSGQRAIESVSAVDRNTSAQDITDIKERVLSYPLSTPLPVNGDGNPRELNGG